MTTPAPFAAFAPPARASAPLRRAITAAYRRDEAEALGPLLAAATLPAEQRAAITATATKLVTALRANHKRGGIEALVYEYALSSDEGVALMCLAEALLRIPDDATRDALIRDKLGDGDWAAHLGAGRSLFVNAATWGLVVTGKLVSSVDDRGLGAALTRLVARAGEPVIRRAVDLAMRMMGERFVTGETIEAALKRAEAMEAKGFRYSYDMLGEAAATMADADRYFADYAHAIDAIGAAAAGRGPIAGPGISIKLSALHPRYTRAQLARVTDELLPRVRDLALRAKRHDIGFNIDAEEADRLELSLDLIESLALDPALVGWQGLGVVVQAYGKRCLAVIDWLVDLAQRARRRIMVRLVKGAYWDAEIKRAQVDGLADFPVYTRKPHTDVSYIACARKLLAARAHVFPQFATHNAQTLASVYHLAGPDFAEGDYEFQCLHGMGEPLYAEVVGPERLARPCRVYAPVGTHETLLAYLVRRLLENGANSSFVNRIADAGVPAAELAADPAARVAAAPDAGARNPAIAAPAELYADRRNSAGLDLSDEGVLADLADTLGASAIIGWRALPARGAGAARPVRNPADQDDIVGAVVEASPDEARAAAARVAGSRWGDVPAAERARILERAADALEGEMTVLLGLIVREAGKSVQNSVGEVREAVDFLRFYAAQARAGCDATAPLGPVACISPWNFPLAIFTGQVAAALAAGNPVLAKPAEETPLIAAQAVRLLHDAGVPADALELVPGDGAVGAALVAAPEVRGVMFTGSTEVARAIQATLADRLSPAGRPIPLIAETGGQNAMIVDSSALPEQVVADVLASAFDSAGQRCSALRILCLQDEIADRTLAMLRGALAELAVGPTDRLSADVGPVITAAARAGIEAHVATMAANGHAVTRLPLGEETARGTFVAPTIVAIDKVSDVGREVFGPVLHVLRYPRAELDALLEQIEATGYGLTFGLHTRLDATTAHVLARVRAGNRYVNRSVIGAVVGVQPFGGRGLSGTGPKAGGPLYLARLVAGGMHPVAPTGVANPALDAYVAWLAATGERAAADLARAYAAASPLGAEIALPGPVGESNTYALRPRGRLRLIAPSRAGLLAQISATLATGNGASAAHAPLPADLPPSVAAALARFADEPVAAMLVAGGEANVRAALADAAARDGALVPVHAADPDARLPYAPEWLCEEVATSINTTAAGGNASLLMLG